MLCLLQGTACSQLHETAWVRGIKKSTSKKKKKMERKRKQQPTCWMGFELEGFRVTAVAGCRCQRQSAEGAAETVIVEAALVVICRQCSWLEKQPNQKDWVFSPLFISFFLKRSAFWPPRLVDSILLFCKLFYFPSYLRHQRVTDHIPVICCKGAIPDRNRNHQAPKPTFSQRRPELSSRSGLTEATTALPATVFFFTSFSDCHPSVPPGVCGTDLAKHPGRQWFKEDCVRVGWWCAAVHQLSCSADEDR